ncbi:DNA primase [Xenophilus sp. Marseille-Q4582]|uniref:DNA primase n=1 Tax=Xenophilus sp. Marseille-Q4582 TaxID=2866600 RepID=UPI001CE3D28B|nr:DNA primase [Xenophilus sp. Marseille-Q4582]
MAIPQSFIQELLARADIVEIVGRYVPLKKGGANFMGLCPFHGEKSPSFSVSPTKQFYHCFGCGAHGNAIGFLMEHGGMGFVEAVHDLAGQYGLQVPEDDASPAERARAAAQREKQATLSDVLEKAAEAYRKLLRQSPRAIAYFKGRGVSGETARAFGLGYAPEGWRTLAGVFPDYTDPLLAESGLVIVGEDGEDKRYDRFRDRVMFPIRNVKGECIGFGGRVLGDRDGTSPSGAGPKYLNSPETPVFSKGQELYGLFEARAALRDKGYALVTEGYMDVVALAQLGFPNAVATLGTACTPDHVRKLFRFTDAVVFSFDGDAAGRRAARKALEATLPFATDTRSAKFLFLPAEHDPDSFIRAHGEAAFARFVAEATPLSRFMVEVAREGCDLDTAEGRALLASHARPLWSALPAGALKHQMLAEFAELIQLDSRELSGLWGSSPPPRAGRPPTPAPRADASPEDLPWEAREAWSPPGSGSGEARGGGWGASGSGRWAERGGGKWGRKGASGPPPGPRGRLQPLSRADVAVRLLLSNPSEWEALSHEQQELLCGLPAPHGTLFAWFESQVHEQGLQPWAALREGLRGHECEAMALKLMAHTATLQPGDDARDPQAEQRAELHNVLDFMLDEALKAQQNAALAQVGSDPQALERYKALEQRRVALRLRLRRHAPDA